MDEVDFSSILSYNIIKVGDMFVLKGLIRRDEHTHTFKIINKSSRIAEIKIKICKCDQNDPVCIMGSPFSINFDELKKQKGLYINTDLGKILYGE